MTSIGRYKVMGRLGRGAMSMVYKARAPVTERLVALKILQPRDDIFAEIAGEERLKEMFLEEARIMGEVQHDHVAKILDCDLHEGNPFIVLEYFAHSLGSLIGEAYRVEDPTRIISVKKTKAYLIQTLKGLERLHFSDIIHRDIKPYNLMLTSDDRVKIIDFGLSRVRGEEKTAIPGMQVGSPYYTAPEQTRNSTQADGRSDLFSLGVLAYRMLTGSLPEGNLKEGSLPSKLNKDLSPEWDECIIKALCKKVEHRYSSARQMRLAVELLPVPQKELCDITADRIFASAAETELRREPCRIMFKDIRTSYNLDPLFRPMDYYQQDFKVHSSQVAYEVNSRLFWQRYGAGFPLNWQQAKSYAAHLNSICWQGRDSWRLPTLEEILTVLSPPLHGVECSTWPMFEPSIHWLWSADYCTKKDAWIVDIAESYISRLDKDGIGSVCAVSSDS